MRKSLDVSPKVKSGRLILGVIRLIKNCTRWGDKLEEKLKEEEDEKDKEIDKFEDKIKPENTMENITEETKFSILRNTDGWYYVSIFLVLGHFGVPFLFLLRQQAKKDLRQVCAICCWILFMHMVDIYWLVIPERGPSLTADAIGGPSLTVKGTFLFDVLAIVTIGCTIAFIFLRTMGKHSIYPCRDPRLQESIDLRN